MLCEYELQVKKLILQTSRCTYTYAYFTLTLSTYFSLCRQYSKRANQLLIFELINLWSNSEILMEQNQFIKPIVEKPNRLFSPFCFWAEFLYKNSPIISQIPRLISPTFYSFHTHDLGFAFNVLQPQFHSLYLDRYGHDNFAVFLFLVINFLYV